MRRRAGLVTGRRGLALAGLAVALLVAALWFSGALSGLEVWAAARQREAQAMMAGALRRLQAGQPGATLALLGICFGYGVVHAVGPGHGKLLIGGYGFGTSVSVGRLSLLSILSALAQASVAVVLVWSGVTLLDLSREALTGLGEDAMGDLGAVLIGLVGLWLGWRGLRHLVRRARHHHHDACGCGHAHGPTAAEVAETRTLRDALILIAGIAARPCTGAIFLLILTWRMDIFATGAAGAMAMGLGTACVSVGVAVLAVWARRGSLALLPAGGTAAGIGSWLPGVMQLAAGAVIAAVAAAMVW